MTALTERDLTPSPIRFVTITKMSKLNHLCTIPDCDRFKEGSTDYCSTHNHAMRKLARDVANDTRKIMERKQRQKPPRTRIAKVSDKKRKDLVLYAPLKAQFLLDKPHCEFNFKDCTKKAIEPHHTSTSERDFLNVETWISTCRSCHNKAEAMPAETRRELGYLIDSPTEEKRTI